MDSTAVNWAEVADRLLTAGESAVKVISDKISEIAPHLWEMAYRQVIVDVIMGYVWGLLLVTPGIVLWRLIIRHQPSYSDNDVWSWKVPPVWSAIVVCGIIAIIGVGRVCISTEWLFGLLINPDWAVIQKIAELAGGGK